MRVETLTREQIIARAIHLDTGRKPADEQTRGVDFSGIPSHGILTTGVAHLARFLNPV